MFLPGDIVTPIKVFSHAWDSPGEALWNFGFFEEWRKVLDTPADHPRQASLAVEQVSSALILSSKIITQYQTNGVLFQALVGPASAFVWFIDFVSKSSDALQVKPKLWRKLNQSCLSTI